MEEQGKEWQPAASLRELAALSELRRDAVKVDVTVLPWGSPRCVVLKAKYLNHEKERTIVATCTLLAPQREIHNAHKINQIVFHLKQF